VLVVLLPALFTVLAVWFPDELGDFKTAFALLPVKFSVDEMVKAGYYFVMNYFTPAYFVLVPIMSASVAAASSFVGEKERRTMETLLFSPLKLKDIFLAKIVGAMCVALMITGISFLGFLAIAITGSILVFDGFVLDIAIWASILFLIAPSISLVSVTVMVFASAKAKTFQEAQQYAALMIVPVMLLFMVPQMTGLFLLNAPQMALIGAGLFLAALLLVRLSSAGFTSEKLL
jgi:ABC-type Na+ efflux pump permease subunit